MNIYFTIYVYRIPLQEANSIPGIGKALADKVWEIARTGHLRKIDHVCKGEEMEALNRFNNIWGVGPTVAQEWVQQVCIMVYPRLEFSIIIFWCCKNLNSLRCAARKIAPYLKTRKILPDAVSRSVSL